MRSVTGLHHVTAIAGPAQENGDGAIRRLVAGASGASLPCAELSSPG